MFTGGEIGTYLRTTLVFPLDAEDASLSFTTTLPVTAPPAKSENSADPTIADLVEEAIRETGGTADLSEIYKSVRKKRPQARRHVIRATVNLNLVDGRARTNRFVRKGRGTYGMADDRTRA